MELLKTVLRLNLTEAWAPWLGLRALIRIAQQQPNAEIQGDALRIVREASKQRISLQIKGLVFEHESPSSLDDAVRSTARLIADFNEASALPPIAFMRFDAILIEPFELPFHELVARMKEQFLRPSEDVAAATDVEFSLDTRDDLDTWHAQLGPMQPEQLLSDFLAFPRDNLPAQFLFMNLGRSRSGPIPYDPAVVENLLAQSAEWQTNKAQSLVATITSTKAV